MSTVLFKQIPNILTTLRLFLAVPVCIFILGENYTGVLWIAFIAGISDVLDGWLARRICAESRYGSIVDPIADKALLISAFVSFVIVGLLPRWVVIIVVVRDIIIVAGVILCHRLMGRYEMTPSFWGKTSTFTQITFVLMLSAQQVTSSFPALFLEIGLWIMIAMAFISGGHYIFTWSRKALVQKK